MGEKESLVHAVCTCVNISVNFSVKLSGYYQRTRGLCTYTAMSSENTETKYSPMKSQLTVGFRKTKTVFVKQIRLEYNHLVP